MKLKYKIFMWKKQEILPKMEDARYFPLLEKPFLNMDNSKVKFDVVPNINIDLAKNLNNHDFVQKIQKTPYT